jgi:hypothetical protein
MASRAMSYFSYKMQVVQIISVLMNISRIKKINTEIVRGIEDLNTEVARIYV